MDHLLDCFPRAARKDVQSASPCLQIKGRVDGFPSTEDVRRKRVTLVREKEEPCHSGTSTSHSIWHARPMLSPLSIAFVFVRSLVIGNSSSAKISAIDASLAKLGELTVCRPAAGPDHLTFN